MNFKPNLETEFMEKMLQLNYGLKVTGKLKKLATKVSWAKGWPEDKKSFWNAEAFMWDYKINKKKRELIKQELSFLSSQAGNKKSKNLDLGCGSYSYLPSIGFDLSEKMLDFNDNCLKKVVGDLEQPLPFKNQTFSSVTAIFVLNYVQNCSRLLSEVHRVITEKGDFVAVLSLREINDWQKQQQVNNFPAEKWIEIIRHSGFKIKSYQKENLLFLKCKLQN